MSGRTDDRRARSSILRTLRIAVAVAVLAGLVIGTGLANSATGSLRPSITKTNDADHDGVFNATETVPKDATYPYSVTYQLSIFGGTAPGPNGPYHTIVAITDDQTSDIGTCQALVGTTIQNNQTETCSYSISLAQAGTQPLVNTATMTWDGAGNDITSNSSTVNFAAPKAKCNSGNGNGSDPIQFSDPNAHCYGGDPGNSYNAGNHGGDEIPTSGGNPNPGGNNVP
jgi:hypothetical protein